MSPAAHELALVVKALTSGVGNCVGWQSDKVERLVRENADNQGLTPVEIKRLLIAHVCADPGSVKQKVENRPNWVSRRSYWYYAVVPVPGFLHGLFVEMELSDDDEDLPEVALVNAHPEKK
jgi:hypothetical protein